MKKYKGAYNKPNKKDKWQQDNYRRKNPPKSLDEHMAFLNRKNTTRNDIK
jgi:hypothetical protein